MGKTRKNDGAEEVQSPNRFESSTHASPVFVHNFDFLRTDEIRYDRSWYSHISQHKDIIRVLTQSGDATILSMKPQVMERMKRTYAKYCHLWNPEMETLLKEFVESNPLTAEIRDKLILYDNQTKEVFEANRCIRMDFLELHFDGFYESCVVHAKAWKKALGKYLATTYRKKLLIFVDFIADMNKILKRTIRDLDDVRVAMNALEQIRQESVS